MIICWSETWGGAVWTCEHHVELHDSVYFCSKLFPVKPAVTRRPKGSTSAVVSWSSVLCEPRCTLWVMLFALNSVWSLLLSYDAVFMAAAFDYSQQTDSSNYLSKNPVFFFMRQHLFCLKFCFTVRDLRSDPDIKIIQQMLHLTHSCHAWSVLTLWIYLLKTVGCNHLPAERSTWGQWDKSHNYSQLISCFQALWKSGFPSVRV